MTIETAIKRAAVCTVELSLAEIEIIRAALFTASYNFNQHEEGVLPYTPLDSEYPDLKSAYIKIDRKAERLAASVSRRVW